MSRNMDKWLGDGGMPLIGSLGAQLTDYGDGWVQGVWKPTELACNPFGQAQAGVHAVLLDGLMNFAINAGLGRDARSRATLTISVTYVRSLSSGEPCVIRGEVIRAGGQIAHAEAWIGARPNQICSQATGSFVLSRQEPRAD